MHPAGRLLVYAVDAASLAEIAPHPETSDAEDTYLCHMHVAADELLQMPVVNVEVMAPLPDARPFDVGIEVRLEG